MGKCVSSLPKTQQTGNINTGNQEEPKTEKIQQSGEESPHGAISASESADDNKQNDIDIKETNLANHGTAEQKELRHGAAQKEEAWVNMTKASGIEIWRVEKTKIVRWPESKYGSFHTGDCYIILNTKDDENNKYDVYFWLGNESSQDEQGIAAYKASELDDYLDAEATQYREVEGNESKNFLDLFEEIKILDGGVDSSFNEIADSQIFNNKLLQITGYSNNIQVYQVNFNKTSLNNHDAFILDTGDKLYEFLGSECNQNEKWRACEISNEIKTHRPKTEIIIVDGTEDRTENALEFWNLLGCDPAKDLKHTDDNIEIELVMQKVSNDKGYMEVTEIQRGKTLDHSNLESNYCYIIDGGKAIFVWCGRESDKCEKRAAMKSAMEYLKLQGRDLIVPISRQLEGRETVSFWKVFEGEKSGGIKDMGSIWKSLFN